MDFNQSFGVNISHTGIQWLSDGLFHSSKIILLFLKMSNCIQFFSIFSGFDKALIEKRETCRCKTRVWNQRGAAPLLSAVSVRGGTDVCGSVV